VDPGGEVVALDAAGYAPLTITKSVTITANPGFYAGIAAGSGDAVTIATASVNVILRGLNINGVGATNGIVMTNGASLSIESCVISNFSSGQGVQVNTPASVRISDTLVRGNSNGIYVSGGATLNVSGVKALGNASAGILVDTMTAATTTGTIS